MRAFKKARVSLAGMPPAWESLQGRISTWSTKLVMPQSCLPADTRSWCATRRFAMHVRIRSRSHGRAPSTMVNSQRRSTSGTEQGVVHAHAKILAQTAMAEVGEGAWRVRGDSSHAQDTLRVAGGKDGVGRGEARGYGGGEGTLRFAADAKAVELAARARLHAPVLTDERLGQQAPRQQGRQRRPRMQTVPRQSLQVHGHHQGPDPRRPRAGAGAMLRRRPSALRGPQRQRLQPRPRASLVNSRRRRPGAVAGAAGLGWT